MGSAKTQIPDPSNQSVIFLIEDQVKDEKKEVRKRKVKEPVTPAAPTIERPVRERKSVERLVAHIEKEQPRALLIGKGRGTALKDIPNVAYKLAKKKTDETFVLLHVILFGKRGKPFTVKNNLSQFSGFAWHENEEKQKLKIKENFDKCVKERLVEFCDVLDIHFAKATTKKEDIVAKLIDFLEAPHATTNTSLAEKEQPSTPRKRNRAVEKTISKSGSTTAKRSSRDCSEMAVAYRPSHANATYDFTYGVRSMQGGGRS